jgi:hypothetical protein
MDQRTEEWIRLLSRSLLWAAGVVLLLSVVGAIQIATSENQIPIFTELQEESRGVATVGALAAGITAAGVLAGLGAILRMLLEGRKDV